MHFHIIIQFLAIFMLKHVIGAPTVGGKRQLFKAGDNAKGPITLPPQDMTRSVFQAILKANEKLTMKDLIEGDIRLDNKTRNNRKRAALRSVDHIWLEGKIHYQISSLYKQNEKETIHRAIKKIQDSTCLKFFDYDKSKEKPSDFIHIHSNEGCWSFIGRNGGNQSLSLDTVGCVTNGIAQHELMHAIGFEHEQSRVDRDDYIAIDYTNIQSGKERNFNIAPLAYYQLIGRYDYYSIMHYFENAFAKDKNHPTITAKKELSKPMGSNSEIEETDIFGINALYHCHIDGGWTEWEQWGTCNSTCGGGSKERHRSCTSPLPMNGGETCKGNGKEDGACNSDDCPIDGRWSSWAEWEVCTVRCGGGKRNRLRKCNNPATRNGGAECIGGSRENGPCNTDACPIDGGWSEWGIWETCNVKCGGGSRNRKRTCDKPAANKSGKTCEGETKESEECNLDECSVDGNWSEWETWGKCSDQCEGGTQRRKRSCDNPQRSADGKDCVGEEGITRVCNEQECPPDGKEYACTFDEDQCQWKNGKSLGGARWKRKGRSQKESEPEFFMSASCKHNQSQCLGSLQSPPLPERGSDSERCLKFNYQVEGNRNAFLEVLQTWKRKGEIKKERLFQVHGEENVVDWNEKQISFDAFIESQIEFEFNEEEGKYSEARIHDISITDGPCE